MGTREPIQLLARLAGLKVASKVANLGLLTKAEDSGLFSKLEASGAFSQAEKLLPLVDELDLITTAEKAVNVPWTYFLIGAAGAAAWNHIISKPHHLRPGTKESGRGTDNCQRSTCSSVPERGRFEFSTVR